MNTTMKCSFLLYLILLIAQATVRVGALALSERIFFPGEHVTNCPSTAACMEMSKCAFAFSSGDRKTFPSICQWNGNQPMVCCPQQGVNEKIVSKPETFPEADCAGHEVVSSPFRRRVGGLRIDRSTFQIAVVGGEDVKSINVYPFMAAIYQLTEDKRVFLCGGTVISKTVVLTAAHCFLSSTDPSKFKIQLGSANFQSVRKLPNDGETFKEFQVTNIKVHHGFKYPQLYNDIALLKFEGLDGWSNITKPVCIIDDATDKKADKQLTVLGWGSKSAGGSISSILQEAVIHEIPNRKCDETLANLGVLTGSFSQGINSKILCAGGLNNASKDACQGDSGGPVVALINGKWRQRGVVSAGIGCGTPGVPGIYTRVAKYTKWIMENA